MSRNYNNSTNLFTFKFIKLIKFADVHIFIEDSIKIGLYCEIVIAICETFDFLFWTFKMSQNQEFCIEIFQNKTLVQFLISYNY